MTPIETINQRIDGNVLPGQENQKSIEKIGQQTAKKLRVANRIRISPAYFNLKESCQYLGISEGTGKKNWPSWRRYGVIPARFPGRILRFKRSDLDLLIENLKVIK